MFIATRRSRFSVTGRSILTACAPGQVLSESNNWNLGKATGFFPRRWEYIGSSRVSKYRTCPPPLNPSDDDGWRRQSPDIHANDINSRLHSTKGASTVSVPATPLDSIASCKNGHQLDHQPSKAGLRDVSLQGRGDGSTCRPMTR